MIDDRGRVRKRFSMQTYLKKFDELAGAQNGSDVLVWLDRIAFGFLVLTALSAPHSIAATQIAWLTGMFIWFVSVGIRWRTGTLRGERVAPRILHLALWAFFAWSVLTALTSHAPDISINKLRGVAVFLIFYFVVYNIRNRRAAHFLAFVLIGSCMVNVLWTPIERLIGRGVEIHGLASDSPLAKALLWEGDTLLEADGVKLHSPEDVLVAIERNESTKIKFYRPDFEFVVEVKRTDVRPGTDAMSKLGISSWKKSSNWRSSGFYGHYTTYAEVLQLIASLVLGLFVAFLRVGDEKLRRGDGVTRGHGDAGELRHGDTGTRGRGDVRTLDDGEELERETPGYITASPRLPVAASLISLVAICLALLLTVTRASQLAFLISATVIVLIGLGRRWLFAAAVVGLPIVLVGLFFLQQSRQVGFFDPNDDSIKWRQTVWKEGFDLWTSSPRNFVVGVGMDSIKRYAAEWHLFDEGRLNMGHFHSTPLNLLVERGFPALLLWLALLAIFARTLWRGLNPGSKIQDPKSNGVLLGCLGGLIGFFISGLVHYNLGDQEVAMVFYLLMGLSVRLAVFSSVDN